MPLDPDALLARRFDPVTQAVSAESCILYALAIGIGRLPLDDNWRHYVGGSHVVPFPTMLATLCREGQWGRWPGTGITPEKCVHVSQTFQFARPLECGMSVVCQTRIVSVWDLGPTTGALVVQERSFFDAGSGSLIATLCWHVLARADGGFGGTRPARPVQMEVTGGTSLDIPIPADAALLYRLTGDANPIHTDPEKAREAGFPAPFMHGLAVLGTGVANLLHAAGARPADLAGLSGHFAAPIYPGQDVRLEFGAVDTRAFCLTQNGRKAMHGSVDLTPSRPS